MNPYAYSKTPEPSGSLGGGLPATAEQVAAVAGPLLSASTELPADVVLRSALTWPVLQHAAWLWRIAGHADDMAVHWALSLQLRADLLQFLETAQDAYRLGISGAAVGDTYPRVRHALRNHLIDEDDHAGLPPSLPSRLVLGEALRRWSPNEVPDDLLVKAQLLVAVTWAREDGFSCREIVDVFAAVLDDMVPQVMATYSRGV